MKTLYVSDLDGTLLRSDAKTSAYTNQVIIQLTSDGILFSYATARSYLTATKATKGLNAKIPIITYNGAVILQNDIEMFEIANESYAVENAVDELKAIATGIIESNDSDGVANWLYNKFCALDE